MKEIALNDELRYILDRGLFEMSRSTRNVSFMINKHIDDNDASYLNSLMHKKLIARAEKAVEQNRLYQAGAVCKLLNIDAEDDNAKLPINYEFVEDNTVLRYQ